METQESRRRAMVRQQLASRDVTESRVLQAMKEVPRERFVAPEMVEFAYEDAPLPIGEGQTISQPYIVALMAQALELTSRDRVLDVGTGSGYAAAVLSRIAAEVYTVERHRSLAEAAERRFDALGYDNVRVRVGDGTLGWEEHAPFDAVNVAAGGPDAPQSLLDQLAPGGRMVIPTGESERAQELVRIRADDTGEFRREKLGRVRFVPLIGVEGWTEEPAGEPSGTRAAPAREGGLTDHVRRNAEPFAAMEGADVEGVLDRIGDARVVLLGEASHGTSEFYRMRARITKELIERKGFELVAVEADWPDARQVDEFVRGRLSGPPGRRAFTRFPTWMWANEEVGDFVHWLAGRNEAVAPEDQVGFYGLDLYSMFGSIETVLDYLDEVDPEAARAARRRYACLTPWERDAASYGRAVLRGRYEECETEVVRTLQDLLEQRLEYAERSGEERFFDAQQNARLVANAERYYRIMYYGSRESWNLRDQHMFDTLEALLDFHGPGSKAVVWEHNSHVGDASATAMGARGEHNVGQLSRERFGDDAYLVGFGTHRGTVAAAHDWGASMEVMEVRPSHARSYERVCHDSGLDRFMLPLRHGDAALRRGLLPERLERAIGVVYRPETELQSHYFHASLPRQFDEYVWFDESRAVTPLETSAPDRATPETFPFAV